MLELITQLRERAEEARAALVEARAANDDYLVDVRLGELRELQSLARDNGVEVPGLETLETPAA